MLVVVGNFDVVLGFGVLVMVVGCSVVVGVDCYMIWLGLDVMVFVVIVGCLGV